MGKTTFLKKNVAKYQNAIVMQLFKTDYGCEQFFYKDFEKIDKRLVNKRIIIEDATQLIASNTKNIIKELVVSSKQLGSDVFLVFHSIDSVPPFLYSLFNRIILFKSATPRGKTCYKEYEDEINKKMPKKAFKYEIIKSNI